MRFATRYWLERGVRTAFFAGLALIGAAFVVLVVRDFADARASIRWPRVDGVVVERTGDRLRYAYVWRGRLVFSSRQRFLTGLAPGLDARAPTFRGARTVEVAVHPERSDVAVLMPGGSKVAFSAFLILGGALVFVGAAGAGLSAAPAFRPH
ncbi:MAG: DUF3592 domain-containing protein [Pseudomonadota bacterium]